jgi:hypothetical protein
VPDVADAALELLALLHREPVGRLAVVVQLELLQRREVVGDLAQGARVAVGDGLLQAREHRPHRRHPGGVRGDVAAHRARADALVVDVPLDAPGAQVRDADELDAALEAGEVGQLLEGGDVLVVGGGQQHLVEVQGGALHGHRRGLAGAQQVLEGLQRPLEQVGVLDHAAVGGHQRPVGLEERQVLQRGRQVRHRAVGGDLAHPGVHRHLRLDGDHRLLVAAVDVEALDLHVAQDLEVVALVGGQQAVEDLPALVAQVALEDVVREREVLDALLLQVRLQQRPALGARDEEDRVVLELAAQARVEVLALQVREAGQVLGLALLAEAERAAVQRRALGKIQLKR